MRRRYDPGYAESPAHHPSLAVLGFLALALLFFGSALYAQPIGIPPTQSFVTCILGPDIDGDGEIDWHHSDYIEVKGRHQCLQAGGAILGGVPVPSTGPVPLIRTGPIPKFGAGSIQREASGIPPQLQTDIQNSGIPGREHKKPEYDCEDFAEDLEESLTDMGYDATVTLIAWDSNGDGQANKNDGEGHAVTDVHLGGGITLWIEPQTGKQYKLDANGDGIVGVNGQDDWAGPPSEGDMSIVIFDNGADARAKYNLD